MITQQHGNENLFIHQVPYGAGSAYMKKNADEAVRRRIRGARLLLAGRSPREVAEALGVSRQTAYVWKSVVENAGIDGLRSSNRSGRPGQLRDEDKEWLRAALVEGSTTHGLSAGLWTVRQVRQLIEMQFGIRFSVVHVWRLMRQLGFSSQKLAARGRARCSSVTRWRKRSL